MESLSPFPEGSYIPYNMPVHPGDRRKVGMSDTCQPEQRWDPTFLIRRIFVHMGSLLSRP